MTLDFLDKIPFLDSIRIALDPGTFPPLPKVFLVKLPPAPPPIDGLSNRFLFDPDAPRPVFAAGL